MRILIAEDDSVSRRILEANLNNWGHEAISARDGNEAWDVLCEPTAPQVAILDWMMPGKDGLEVCRLARQLETPTPAYIILLTAKDRSEDIVSGLNAGANDYVKKPYDRDELRARLNVGIRVIELQNNLAIRVLELEDALSRLKTVHGLLPICSYCKRIRNDDNYWEQVESYLSDHSELQFTHSFCPDCFDKHLKPELEH
ncbi:MAG: response regulator transcription factor [Acidobacteria bacterium]|nr:response regulator transcription factor [Acidobacteriota bacterium]